MTVGAAPNVVSVPVGLGVGSVVAGPVVAAAKVTASDVRRFLYGPRFLAGEVEPTVTGMETVVVNLALY